MFFHGVFWWVGWSVGRDEMQDFGFARARVCVGGEYTLGFCLYQVLLYACGTAAGLVKVKFYPRGGLLFKKFVQNKEYTA